MNCSSLRGDRCFVHDSYVFGQARKRPLGGPLSNYNCFRAAQLPKVVFNLSHFPCQHLFAEVRISMTQRHLPSHTDESSSAHARCLTDVSLILSGLLMAGQPVPRGPTVGVSSNRVGGSSSEKLERVGSVRNYMPYSARARSTRARSKWWVRRISR